MVVKIISIVCYILFAPVVGGLLAGVDRKISAHMQGRRGPSILQPFYDLFKLFSKESVVVNRIQVFFVFGFLVFVVFTGALFFMGGDLLLSFFTLTVAAIFLVLSASSANSPYSAIGSQRELIQMMAYEPMVLLTAIGFYVVSGSFSVSDIVKSQMAPVYYLPGLLIGYLYILTIKLRKSPFDISTSHHAHQEIVKGITTELSGTVLALTELAHWYENVYLLGILALFFINQSWYSIIVAVVLCALFYFVEILTDNVFARVKWQSMLKWTWIVTLVAGIVNIAVLMI